MEKKNELESGVGGTPQTAPEKEKGMKKGLLAACVGVALLLIFVGYSGIQKNKMERHFAQQEYSLVLEDAKAAPWLRKTKENEYLYSSGQVALQNGEEQKAREFFIKIKEFADAEELYQKTTYSMAEEFVRQDDLRQALECFESLGEYKESALWCQRIKEYTRAEEMPADKLLEKHEIYTSLQDYFPIAQKHALAISEQFYTTAVDEYELGNFETALPYFLLAEGFEEADLYIDACELWELGTIGTEAAKMCLPQLEALSEKIDIAPVVLSNEFLVAYLQGRWEGENGKGFTLSDKTFEFQGIDLGEGYFEIIKEGIYQQDKEYIKFNYINYNTIELIETATGETTMINRK